MSTITDFVLKFRASTQTHVVLIGADSFDATDTEAKARIAAFLQGLQKWGWTDGGNAVGRS
jgi:hypothetical protein